MSRSIKKGHVPCGLRGPVAADLHRAHFVPLLEASPPRHPFARYVLHGGQVHFDILPNGEGA